LPDREKDWSLVTGYRADLAREARQWDEAERIERARVDWNRRRAAAASGVRFLPGNSRKPEAYAALQNLDVARRNDVRSLAISLERLGSIQRWRQQPDCVASYDEALALAEAINDRIEAAICAFNLGDAYCGIYVPTIRDLAQAERWYRRSLGLYHEEERHDRAKCLNQLGAVNYARFVDSLKAKETEAEWRVHFSAASQSCQQALVLLPPDAVDSLAVTHQQLGMIYGIAGDIDRALYHLRETIRLDEASHNVYGASQARLNVAVFLSVANRKSDARSYGRAALRGFETYGDSAAADIAKTQQLLAKVEQAIHKQGK
jgi:tetratricopeptide (TPR) repeat protein